jgi:tetratricopeptide (TPR) repeat protein
MYRTYLVLFTITFISIINLKNASCKSLEKQIDSLNSYAYSISSSNHAKAFVIVDSVLSLSVNIGYTKGEADALRIKGLSLFYGIQYSQALLLFIKSQEKYKQIGDTIGLCNANNLIATVYSYQGFHEKALEKHRENLAIRRIINDQEGISMSLNNIAVTLRSLGKLHESLNYYRFSLEIIAKSDDIRSYGRVLNNIGNLFLELHQPDSAFLYFQKSLT